MMATTSALLAAALAVAGSVPGAASIEAPGPSGKLSGTLLAASGKAPVMLMIPGSGPTDRDGNSPLGIKAAPYRLLAEALAARGVSTVRIDKRGMFGSAAAVPDANAVTIQDYVEDVRSWIGAARARTGADCVWLLGHSEGGLVALASHALPGTCGLILVSSPGRKMSDILKEQLRANPANAPLLNQAFGAIDALSTGKKVDVSGLHPAFQSLFAPQIQNFWISVFSYDPAALIATYTKPVLIVQGDADLQVKPADAARLAAANKNAKVVVLPGVNHVLKVVPPANVQANLASYSNPDLPLAPGIAEAISTFVKDSGQR